MSYVTSRLNYYNGQFLRKDDFIAEQSYHAAGLQAHERLLHVAGIAEGLDVALNGAGTSLTVSAGAAVDPAGKQILLDAPRSLAVPLAPDATLYATIDYAEQEDVPAGPSSIPGNMRIKQAPTVVLAISPGTSSVVLAKITISNGVSALDRSVRAYSGIRLPSPVSPAPTLSVASDGSEVRLSGNLSVGRLKATGATADATATAISALNSAGTQIFDLLNSGFVKMSKLAVTRIAGTSNPLSQMFPMTASFTSTGAPVLMFVSGQGTSPVSFVGVSVDEGTPGAFDYQPLFVKSGVGNDWRCTGAVLVPGGFAAGSHQLSIWGSVTLGQELLTGNFEVIMFELPFDTTAFHAITGAFAAAPFAIG